jgi:hypothetical protein
MKTSVFILIFILMYSCGNYSNGNGKKQTRVYSTPDGDFIVSTDTLKVNLKPYVPGTVKVSLTHAVKYKDAYYCYFTNSADSYNKYLFVISDLGVIEREITLPKEITDCYYLDLFVMHDTIFTKPYMQDKSFYLDMHTLRWIETPEPDDVIYEDERFYVTYLDFGEWGSTTWFRDKLSGKEYELASSGEIINRVNGSYYISEGLKVLKIENPLKMKPCDTGSYYRAVKKVTFHEGTTSMLGAETLFEDTTCSFWDRKEPELVIATSFRVGDKLFWLCTDKAKTFIAKLESRKMVPVQVIGGKYSTFNWSYSYRCIIQKDNFQLLKFGNKSFKTIGFIEIDGNKINIRYMRFN